MDYKIIKDRPFLRKYKKYTRSGNEKYLKRIDITVTNLVNKVFTTAMNPHPLDGKYKGYYDVHADYDLIIIYKYEEKHKQLFLHDVGTHSEFGFHESIDDYTKEEMETILRDL